MIFVNGEKIDLKTFPAGELNIKLKPISTEEFVEIKWNYEDDSELFPIYCIRNFYSKNKCGLSIPYLCHARMDRVKNNNDVFTLKYFANFINSLGFSWVKVRDPHSAVSEALIDNLIVESAEKYIRGAIKECDPDMVFYPDEGAMKRYSSFAPMEYAFGVKRRDWSTGKIKGLDVMGDVKKISGKDILIIDDICSKGGTFYQSATKLKELGANNIYLYVTHCENTIFEGELLEEEDLIEHIYTSESIFTGESEKIDIIKL